MESLGDEALVESRFGPSGDSASLDARWMHDLRRMYRRLINNFGSYGISFWYVWRQC
jgi:hypothetical protein